MKRYKIIIYILTFFYTFLISVELSSQTIKKEALKRVDEMVVDLMEEGDIPGLSLSIVEGEKDTILNFGYANLKHEREITSKTLFEIGSNSKAFTALAIMDLVLKEKVNIELDISDYIPWFEMTYENISVKIKVKHLLHHTSGIPWNTVSDIPESNDKDALEKTVKTLLNRKLSHFPGEKYEYATINYDLLALILEYVTGVSFEDYMQTIFSELQLENTSVGIPKERLLKASGYKISFFDSRPFDAPKFRGNNAAGYIISNSKDISKWIKLQLDLVNSNLQGAIKSTHQRDETVPLHNMSSYAKGWEVSLSGNGEIYHSGLNPNFSSYILLRPKDSFGVAILANSNSMYTSLIAERVVKILMNEEIDKKYKPSDQNDGLFSMLSMAFSIYIIFVVAYMIFVLTEIVKNKRTYREVTLKNITRFFGLFFILSPFLLAIYLIPEALAGFNWKAILLWTPASFEALIKLSLLSILISCTVYFIEMFFPEKNFYKKKIPRIILFSILSGLANVLVIIIVTSSLDSDLDIIYLIFYFSLIAAVYLIGRRYVQSQLIKINQKLMYDIRIKIVNKAMQTSFQKLERMDSGRIFTVLNEDVSLMGGATATFVNLITSMITIIGAFAYMFTISLWATLLIIITMICLASIYYFVGQRANSYFESVRDERNIFMNLVNGMIGGIKEISLHRNKKLEYIQDLSKSALEFKNKNTIAETKFIDAFLVGESLLLLLLGLVSIGLSRLYPSISFFTLMSFVIVLLYLIGPINAILNAVPHMMRLRVSWNRIQRFLKEIPADISLATLQEKVNHVNNIQNIKVEDVTFNYPSAINDKNSFGIGPINFEVNKGEVLFITGGNGSGKTTLAKILMGLYKADKGKITINEKEVSNSELGEYFSATFNPLYLFKKLYGIITEDRKPEINNLLKILQLEDKVEIENNQFSTIDLSAGQRKRLNLLKCYLEDLPIFLFDEWAADQDPDYRYFFYRELIPKMKESGKIVIAISHDDHYFDVADKIVQMREGKMTIIHNDLMV